MKKIVTSLSLALLLNASNETCHTVQVVSAYNSPDNFQEISSNTYPDSCELMEIGKNITVRCGCFDEFRLAEESLNDIQRYYSNAMITKTYKHRFLSEEETFDETEYEEPQTNPVMAQEEELATEASISQTLELDEEENTFKVEAQTILDTSTSADALTLIEAIEKLKTNNLEIQGANYDVSAAKAEEATASGNHWGKLNFIQDIARSDDAGNVFGFKLTSREASFGDFGFSEFSLPSTPEEGETLLATEPEDLNYPDDRNFFQSKLKYEVPIFTGFQISSYTDILEAMSKMKTLEKEQVINEKVYELRKSFYDMALLKHSTYNLQAIANNILKLEDMTRNMIEVGYAKTIDLLEVQAKKGNVERLIAQMESNEKLLYHYISFLLNENVTEIVLPNTSVAMIETTNEEILKNNLDIQRATTGLKVREGMVDVAESSYYPVIGAFGEFSTADDEFLGDAGDHKAYTVGARLTWNLFNGGIDYAELEKSQIAHLKTKTEVQLARAGIELKVQKIRTEIASLDGEIRSLEKELNLLNEIYANYEGRYKEKLTSMSNVIIKQSEQIEKILQLQMVKNKRNERIFALEKIANGDIK